jgi:hypothetical protein
LLGPPSGDALGRTYLVVGYSRSGKRNTPSALVTVPVVQAPQPPTAPVLTYTADRFMLAWQPPLTIRRPVQDPATGGVLPSVPRVEILPGSTYNVYEVDRARVAPAAAPSTASVAHMPTPVNEQPLTAPAFEDPRFAFGVERCYVIRTVDTFGSRQTVESEPSAAVCVTPRDTFPPAAPKGLQAVPGDGAISLSWDPNAGADLAGYLVLRAIAPGGTLERLTPEPIPGTTYSDTTAKSGVRYIYAVVAVDTAVPPNASAASNKVEVVAR